MTDEQTTDEDDDEIFVDIFDEYVIESESAENVVQLFEAMVAYIQSLPEDRDDLRNDPVRAFFAKISKYLSGMTGPHYIYEYDGDLEDTDWSWVGRWTVGALMSEAMEANGAPSDSLVEASRSVAAVKDGDGLWKRLDELSETIRSDPDLERLIMLPILVRMKADLESAIAGDGPEDLVPIPEKMDWFWLAVLFRDATIKN